MDAFNNMALQFELSSVGSLIFNIPRTSSVDDKGMRYLITIDGSMES